MKKKLKIAFIVGLLLLGFGAFLPIRQVVVVPRWELQFVDESQRPLSNIQVKQEWIDHTYEFWRPGMHSDVLVTDNNGEAVFPERVLSIPTLSGTPGSF